MKKRLCILLAAVLIVSLLAGCAGPAPAEQTPAEATAQTPAEEAPAAATAGKTEISLITWRSEDADVFKTMIADFESIRTGCSNTAVSASVPGVIA